MSGVELDEVNIENSEFYCDCKPENEDQEQYKNTIAQRFLLGWALVPYKKKENGADKSDRIADIGSDLPSNFADHQVADRIGDQLGEPRNESWDIEAQIELVDDECRRIELKTHGAVENGSNNC